MHQLDLVLPCYNPGTGWKENVIYNVHSLVQNLPDTELFIILINDGSTTGVIPEDLQYLRQSIPNFTNITYNKNQGKGYALRKGIQAAKHEVCIYTDVDFPYTTKSFIKLYNALISQEADIVAGVRNQFYYTSLTQNRTYISKILKVVNRKILRLPVSDTQCGLKGFNQKGRRIFLSTRINRYLFDLEFIFLAAQNPKIKLSSVAVELKPGIIFQKMNWKILTAETISLLKISMAKALALIK